MKNTKDNKQLVQSYSINEELLEDEIKKPFKKSYKYTMILVGLLILLIATLIIVFIYFIIKNSNKNKLDNNGLFNKNNETLKNNNETLNKDNNDFYENPEYQKFYDSLPASLKSDSEGNFHLDKSGFKYMPNNKKKYKEEHHITIDKMKSSQMSKMNGNTDASVLFDITILHSYFNFLREVNEKLNESIIYESNSFVAKIIISSVTMISDELCLENSFISKIEKIANENSYTDIEKAKELDKLIDAHGYFIPLKIYFGGLFILESEDIEKYISKDYLKKLEGEIESKFKLKDNDTYIDNKINITGNYNKNSYDIFNELYSISKKVVLGGEINTDNFNDWKNSINIQNAEAISYDNIIKITYLLDEDLKIKLKEPFRLIDIKYENRRKYYETINKLKEIKRPGSVSRNGNDDFELGFNCNYHNLIYTKISKVDEEWQIGKVKKTKESSSNDIIVGVKIISNKKHNGKWTIEENPLLKNNMNIKFTSDNWRGLKYDIIIYAMRFPE